MSDDQKYSDGVMRLLNELPTLYFHSMPVLGEILNPDDPLAFDDTLVYNAKLQLDLYDLNDKINNANIVAFSVIYYNGQQFIFQVREFEFSYILALDMKRTNEDLYFLLAVSNSIPGLFLAMTRIFGFIQAGILPGVKIGYDDNNDNDNNDNGE